MHDPVMHHWPQQQHPVGPACVQVLKPAVHVTVYFVLLLRRALYLQSNDISCLEGLESCTQLEHLNINGNPVQSLRGLPASLTTLHASSVGGLSMDSHLHTLRSAPGLRPL